MALVQALRGLRAASGLGSALSSNILEACTIAPFCLQTRSIWKKISLDTPNPPGGKGGRYPYDKPAPHKQYWFKVDYPEDGKYTVDMLPVTKVAGRDPVTGKVVVRTRGGGLKFKYRWLDTNFPKPDPGTEGPVEEKIIYIKKDPVRTGFVALLARGNYLRYAIATDSMKAGDVVRTFWEIPKIPVLANQGDSHPLGALPVGTQVCNIEQTPGGGSFFCRAAGTSATITRKQGDRVILRMPNKKEFSFDEKVMAVVGSISNPGHGDEDIGSPNRLRWLGYRPRSGLWQRKDGYCGRKIRPLPPVKLLQPKEHKNDELIEFTVNLKGPRVKNYRGAWRL